MSGRRRWRAPGASATPCRSWCGQEGGNFALAPWDWRYYAEKVRRPAHDLDEAEIKPYLQLERVDRGGLRHRRAALRPRLHRAARTCRVYHPDVRAWEVTRDGPPCRAVPRRLFRPALEAQRRLDERYREPGEAARRDRPIIVNVLNFAKEPRASRAARLRRRPHPVPRVRPCAARAAVRRHLSASRRHRGADATSSSSRRSSTSTG